jgi:hypothetical protein
MECVRSAVIDGVGRGGDAGPIHSTRMNTFSHASRPSELEVRTQTGLLRKGERVSKQASQTGRFPTGLYGLHERPVMLDLRGRGKGPVGNSCKCRP